MTYQDVFTANVQLSEFALQLRNYRQDNNLSFGAFACLLGVSVERLGLLELDRVTPSLSERRRFERLQKQQKITS